MALSNAQRQQRFKDKKRREGYVRLEVTVLKRNVALIKAYIEKVEKGEGVSNV